jgi:hypothetical protein
VRETRSYSLGTGDPEFKSRRSDQQNQRLKTMFFGLHLPKKSQWEEHGRKSADYGGGPAGHSKNAPTAFLEAPGVSSGNLLRSRA